MPASMFTVKTKDGTPVNPGDEITDFRGDKWTFGQITRAPEPGKSAKIAVNDQCEFYATVFDLVVEIVLCEWFAQCLNDATGTEPHPILGDVPICDRCRTKNEALR